MGNPPPLSVDPEQLRAAGHSLVASAADLPAAPVPFTPAGSDPLSLAIIGQIPEVDGPIMAQLPVLEAQATKTASSVVAAADAYEATDQQLGGQISQEMQTPGAVGTGGGGAPGGPAAAGSAGSVTAAGAAGSAGGGATGSMGQLMGMPMQMAQMPMQVMGAVAAAPQGAMQGVQQVGQQVSQMAAQFGQGGMGTSSGDMTRSGAADGPTTDGASPRDGAAAADPNTERAPEHRDTVAEETTRDGDEKSPGRHRRPEAVDQVNL